MSLDEPSQARKETRTWILDSGATSHICGERAAFSSIRPCKQHITTATGEESEVLGIGRIRLTLCSSKGRKPLILKNVYYVPSIQMNLISVSQLNEMGITVIHQAGVTTLQRGDRVLGQARLVGGLYRLSVRPRPTTANQLVMPVRELEPMELTGVNSSGGEFEGPTTSGSVCHQEAARPRSADMKPSEVVTEQLWHMRLGHINYADVQKVLRDTGTEHCRMTGEELKALPRCPACMQGKMTRRRFNRKKRPSLHSKTAFELIHADVAEMPVSPEGFRYFIQFTDDFSRGTWAYPMKTKGEALECLKRFYTFIKRQFGAEIKRILTDNGRELRPIAYYLERQGGLFETSAPYSKEQNGLSERTIRTLKDRLNTLRIDAKIPISFWPELLNTVTYLKLRSPASILRKRTPFEALYGKTPKLDHLRRIGCVAWVHIPKELRGKIDERAVKAKLLGYEEPNQYLLIELASGRLITSRDVVFDENAPIDDLTKQGEATRDKEPDLPVESEFNDGPHEPNRLRSPHIPDPNDVEMTDVSSNSANPLDLPPPPVNPLQNEVLIDLGTSSYGRKRQPTKRLLKSAVFQVNSSFSEGDPQSYQEAMTGPDKVEWKVSKDKEYNQLMDKGTWTLIPRDQVPKGARIIGCKWVFKTKSDGTKKSRLVIKGFKQRYGKDFHETFAAVSRLDSVRLTIATATLKKWVIQHWDVTGAFLHGDVDTEIYMEMPEGHEIPGYVCCLNKSLYGLKQAPRIWYQCVKQALRKLGFRVSEADNCMFYRKDCVICVYVDDFLAIGESDNVLSQVFELLNDQFSLRNLGFPKLFLGIEVVEHPDKSVSLHQAGYVKKILSKYCMEDSKEKTTPMAPNVNLNADSAGDYLDEESAGRYQSGIGALMFLMVGTRPDIAFALSVLSRFTAKPQRLHESALQRLFRYLKSSVRRGITYSSGDLIGYTDADFGGSVVTDGAYSTSGYVFKLAGGPVSWSSKRQGEIATSTTHAEYIGQYNAILQLQWLRSILEETNLYTTPTTHIYADNQSAIALSQNPEFHKRTKHFNVKLHYQRAVLEAGDIKIGYVPTQEEAADGLTKPLTLSLFKRFLEQLGMKDVEEG